MNVNKQFRLRSFVPRRVKEYLKGTFLNYYRILFLELFNIRNSSNQYSQTGEDKLIEKFLPESEGFYLDVGAGRPIRGSNSFAFYLKGWTGICVDPLSINERLFNVLRNRDQFLRILVGQKGHDVDFWEFDPYEYSTTQKSVASRVLNNQSIRLINHTKLQVTSLAEIAPEISPQQPAFLSIDTEGNDLEVLKSNDWNSFRPRVICVEAWEASTLKSEIGEFLNGKNYLKRASTSLSDIYIEKSYIEEGN